MRKPYVVLGHYEPSEWDKLVIQSEMWAELKKFRLQPFTAGASAEVRDPYRNADVIDRWHQDIAGCQDPRLGIVIWSNEYTTQLRQPSKPARLYQANPFDIILFRNANLEHRKPPAGDESDSRWFFRQFVVVPKQYAKILI